MRVYVHLKFDTGTSGTIVEDSIPELVNVSSAENMYTEASRGQKGFQLSDKHNEVVCSLDGTYSMYSSKGYQGIITRVLSNSRGYFPAESTPAIELTLSSYNLKKLYVGFDQACHEYATEISLKNNTTGEVRTVHNDKTVMQLDVSNNTNSLSSSITISITKWSRAYASAKISYIVLEYASTFTGNTLKELVCSENTFNSQAYVCPGIVEQYANIKVYDRYQYLHSLAEEESLLEGALVKIAVVDENDEERSLGSFVVDAYVISAVSSEVQINCKDPSETFSTIYVENLPVKDRSVDDMLTLAFKYASSYTWKYVDAETAQYCKKIKTPNSWFESGTLQDLFNKICNLGMLRIYWYDNSFVVARCW